MASLFNINSKRFVSKDTQDRLTYDPPAHWRPTSQGSSDSSASHSSRCDGFDRLSSPTNNDSSWSRESSPAFEIILDPDLSHRKEAARQFEEANGALPADLPSNDNATSLPSGTPSSSNVSSYEDSNMEDELWNELMGVSDTDTTEPQPGKDASAPDSGNTGADEDEEDDEILAMMTDALDKELEEMHGEQQHAAEKETAEPARREALLEEQMRVAAEKSALAKQFDYLHESPRKNKKAASIHRRFRRPSLNKRLSHRLDVVLKYDNSREALARRARREALKAKALKKIRASVSTAVTRLPEAVTRDTLAANSLTEPMTTEAPASNSSECTVSAAGTSMQSIQELPRVYHRIDRIDWRPLWERMTLTTNLDTQACIQCLGLDPVRGQEISDKLRDHLRAPGNSVSISRQDTYSNRAKQIISQLAHNLLCDQFWGQTYFNQPHVECGYSNVRFETDSTWILIEFSKLLYKIVKAEERRRKAQLRNQQKRDAKNAAKHPVASDFVTAPSSHVNAPPSDLRQTVVPQPVPAPQQVPASHPVARTSSVPLPVGYAPTPGQRQAAVPQPVPVPAGHTPPRGLYQAPDPLLVSAPLNVSVPPQVSAQHQAARTFVPAPAGQGNAPHRGLHQAIVHQHGSAPLSSSAPAVYAPSRSLHQAAVPRPVSSQNPGASIIPCAPASYISPHELRRAAVTQQTPAPGRKTIVDFKEYMAMYGRKR